MPNETGTKRSQSYCEGGANETVPNYAVPSPATRAASHPMKPCAAGPSLWSEFWQDLSLENRPQERCHVPGDGRSAVDGHWAEFAAGLPYGAQVIDLGCGAGITGRLLLGHRSDLHVTGVDFAKVPTPPVANLTIYPWTSMEALPFADGGFDAAISLFGIEYGEIDKTARELERVLKPGARFSFLVHHCESEILREGSARRRAIRDLLWGNMKAAFLAGSTARIDQQRLSLRQQYPAEPMVKLVSDHFLRNITRTRAERQAVWQKLAGDADPETALLALLERSAKSPVEMGAWLVALLSGMALVSVSVLRRRSGEPIAWDVQGSR